MKSRISFCNGTALRKDITRFAPLWALYFIGGMLVMLTLAIDNKPHSLAYSLGNTIGYFSMINIVYAALCAQVLFGDLFNSRLCNALHALPLRREHWFLSHITAGLLFSLVPNTVGILCVVPWLGEFWYVALLWLLGMTLHFLFFFGLAVFSCMCTGNRFAMVAVYGIINFIAPLAGWFMKTVYEPMLYSVELNMDAFTLFCPAVRIFGGAYLRFEWDDSNKGIDGGYAVRVFEGLDAGWIYLAAVALIGVVLLVMALLLYRRRNLESAGDFMAVRTLRPVFSLLYTLCMGAVFALFGELFGDSYLVLLFIGLAVGYFTGQMLLDRTIKVFKKRAFLRCVLIGVTMAASLLITRWDLLGITRWSPAPESVASITVSNSYDDYHDGAAVTDEEQIRQLLDVQKELMKLGEAKWSEGEDYISITFCFKLKDGREVIRTYNAPYRESCCEPLRKVLSAPEHVLGYSDIDAMMEELSTIIVEDYDLTTAEMRRTLLEAIFADCAAGNMAQLNGIYPNSVGTDSYIYLTFINDRSVGIYSGMSIRILSCSQNTINWIRENMDAVKTAPHE